MAARGFSPEASAMKARNKGRLTDAFVRSVNRPGVYCDQHGLRLRVYGSRKLKSISKHWLWRGTVNGTRRDVGLGAYPYVSLVDARQQAFEYRKVARAGGDPVALMNKSDVPTFAGGLGPEPALPDAGLGQERLDLAAERGPMGASFM